MNYILHLLVLIGLYVPLVYSLNLTLGFGGLTSFCHAVFYGIGAYTYALLATSGGVSTIAALFAAVAVTSAVAACVGVISLRFRGDLFLFVTLGIQMIVFVVLYNWIGLTNGPQGIPAIPRLDFLGVILQSPLHYVLALAIIDAVILWMLFAIYQSPFGITLKAVRDDEVAAVALGINSVAAYLEAFVISAAFAAVPGALYASYVTFIDPSSFTLKESIFIVTILLLGGTGNRRGPAIGIIIMLLLPEMLRLVGLPDEVAPNVREIIYGLLLALLMYFRPQGIAGEFAIR